MTENSDPPGNGETKKPSEVPPPPPIMPTPDIVDPKSTGPTYGGSDDKKGKKKKKDKKRSHPLDPYEPLKKNRGCNGCCGCAGGILGLIVVLLIALIASVGWFGPGRYVLQDYEVVSFEEAEVTISEAPTVPTYYIGNSITYAVPSTTVSVAIAAATVSVSGHFGEDVSLTGIKVFGRSNTTIEGNLEVYAAEFLDEGITLTGELKGSVMKNTAP